MSDGHDTGATAMGRLAGALYWQPQGGTAVSERERVASWCTCGHNRDGGCCWLDPGLATVGDAADG